MDKRRKSGDIRLANLVSLQAQLIEDSLHVDSVPQDDHLNNESQRTELILLSLPIPMTQFASLAVEDSAPQAVCRPSPRLSWVSVYSSTPALQHTRTPGLERTMRPSRQNLRLHRMISLF